MTPCCPPDGYQFFGDRCWQHFRRKAKIEVEGRVVSFGESLDGSGAQMNRPSTALC